MTRWRFNREARADLERLLRKYAAQDTIRGLELAIDRYHAAQRLDHAGSAENRRVQHWLGRLQRQLQQTRESLADVDPDVAASLTYADALNAEGRASLHEMLTTWAAAAQQEIEIRTPAPGPKRVLTMVLNGGIAAALNAGGVPLKKSRQSVAHQVFVIIYDALGLTRQRAEGDLFRPVKQGIDLATRGIHVRRVVQRSSHR